MYFILLGVKIFLILPWTSCIFHASGSQNPELLLPLPLPPFHSPPRRTGDPLHLYTLRLLYKIMFPRALLSIFYKYYSILKTC